MNLRKYLEGEIIRVRAAEYYNFSEMYSNGDEHLYSTAYNVVLNLLSLSKNDKLEITSKFNHQLVRSTIENIFLLRMFREGKIFDKYVMLYKQHFKVINFKYLSMKFDASNSNRLLSDLKSSYNNAIKVFMSYFPNLTKNDATKIFSKRFGWLYSFTYNSKETKLINVLKEYGAEYELEMYRISSVYAHANFFRHNEIYWDGLLEYCMCIINDAIDISNLEMPYIEIDYPIQVSSDECGDLQADKIMNYTHPYKLKFKQMIELAATKSYLERNPDKLSLYILTSYLKSIKYTNSRFYKDRIEELYELFTKNSDTEITKEFFRTKVVNKLFGFTVKKSGQIDDYDTFIKKQLAYLKEKRIISDTYASIVEEVNLLDHPSMYAYLNINQGDISEYTALEKQLKDYLYR